MKIPFLGPLVAVALVGCAAAVPTLVSDAPVLVNVACQLAADQGTAEPGWELQVCSVLDPSGKPTGTSFRVMVKKGTTLATRRAP